MREFSILRQSGTSHMEPMVAVQYAMMADVPIKSVRIESLEGHTDGLRQGTTVPIGSVEFVRKAMALAGITEPENLSYPEPLRPYLRRQVLQCTAGSVLGYWFIKPTTTKAFTLSYSDYIKLLWRRWDHLARTARRSNP